MKESKNKRDPHESRNSFLLAGVFICVVAVVGVVLVVLNMMSDHEESPPPPDLTVVTEDHCQLTHGGDVPTADMVKANRYIRPDGTSMVVSDVAGPCQVDGIPQNYAHSPTGALIASVNFVWLVQTNERVSVLEHMLVPGQDSQALIDSVKGSEQSDSVMRLYGFQLAPSGTDAVAVQLAIGPPGSETAFPISLVMSWQDDDWKVVPASRSEIWRMGQPLATGALSSLGWTIWGF